MRCECGFRFDVDNRGAVLREHQRWRDSCRTQLLGGLALAALGGGVTLLSYVNIAPQGGTFIIWTGALVGGAGLAIRALLRMRAIGRAEEALEREPGVGSSRGS